MLRQFITTQIASGSVADREHDNGFRVDRENCSVRFAATVKKLSEFKRKVPVLLGVAAAARVFRKRFNRFDESVKPPFGGLRVVLRDPLGGFSKFASGSIRDFDTKTHG